MTPPPKQHVRRANFPLLLNAVLPNSLLVLVGAAIGVASYAISPKLGAAAIALLGSISLYSSMSMRPSVPLNKGRMTVKCEGDFVLFLIGIRFNKLTSKAADMGKYMDQIEKELSEHPELGCLGSESYVGSNTEASTTLLVQYWKSTDHLEKYAQSSTNSHYHPWRVLMSIGKESTEFGFWHETYQVKAGEYECIHVNCPAFHFANALGARVEAAEYASRTMRGRLGKGEGSADEWPEGYAKDSHY
jgi:hypothetical protein